MDDAETGGFEMAGTAESLPRGEIMDALRRLGKGEIELDDLPEPVVELLLRMTKRTREEYREHARRRREREARAPAVGAPAPDFELELLSPEGKRTGERRRLGAFRGRPVALIFGSFT